MGEIKENEVMDLLIDEDYRVGGVAAECKELTPILKNFVESYVKHKDDMTVDDWLFMKMREQLPKAPENDIREASQNIIKALEITEEKREALRSSVLNGKSKEGWFAEEVKAATIAMNVKTRTQYLQQLDDSVRQANEALRRTILTKEGLVSKNPYLDGYIAEQYHAQTFNMNATLTKSRYRARVLEPQGEVYSKNGVDIVIFDTADGNRTVGRYQSKYCKDVEATIQAFKEGDYRGQKKLVSSEVKDEIKNASDKLVAPDGTSSKPLAKSKAKRLRDEVQSGKEIELNWGDYQTKDLVKRVGQEAGFAALQGMVLSVGIGTVQKVLAGEEIDGDELIENMICSGTDSGIKAAAAGALTVGVEKGIITAIPKGTHVGVIANIAYVAVEDLKVVGKMASGEYGIKEGMDQLAQTTVVTAAGLVGSVGVIAAAGEIGAILGITLGPVGAVVGAAIGGSIGYMAGSKFGESIAKGQRKIRDKAIGMVKSVAGNVKNLFQKVVSFA